MDKVQKCDLKYTLHITIECNNVILLEKSIDEFLKNLPELIESLKNTNEKVSVKLDKEKVKE